jgi:hypothetical protein
MRGIMKQLLLASGCIAMLSACAGGSGSLGAGSASSGGSAGSANSSGSIGSGSFGSKRTEDEVVKPVEALDRRAFVTVLKSARSERNNSGTIVRVIGEMDRIGYHDLELVRQDDEFGDTITFQARAAAPAIGRAALTPRSRVVTLGAFIPTTYRPNARIIVIQGLNNNIRIKR